MRVGGLRTEYRIPLLENGQYGGVIDCRTKQAQGLTTPSR